jgi:(4S)-4-hydroxy-5-phosphonooxypentane-2,3-dione isomerase
MKEIRARPIIRVFSDQGGHGMSKFVLTVGIVIKPDQVDRFMPLLLENARATRETESGCRAFDVLVDPKDRTRIMLYEVYDDEAAFDAHQKTPHFQKYLAEAIPLLQSRDRYIFRRVAP